MKSLLFLAASLLCSAQITFPTTTLTHKLTYRGAEPVQVASVANIFASANQYPGNGSIGDPTGPGLTILLIDQEALCVQSVLTAQLTVNVIRGCQGTYAQNHAVNATVYAGPAWYYYNIPPAGTSCTASEQTVLPYIVLPGAEIFNCTNGQWVVSNGFFMTKAPHKHWYSRFWAWMRRPF